MIRLDPDRTQIIRPGTVEPPGERTEIVRLPVKGTASVAEPAPVSMADAERPNFAEDPTSRIVPPDRDRDGDGDGTERSGEADRRGMTVMSMERPPGEEPEIPAQRRPS